jgi:hypothetical protein
MLAGAMAAAGLEVTVALGGRATPDVPFSGVRVAQLPPAGIRGEDFSTLVDENGAPVNEAWRSLRRAALLQVCSELNPDVLLLETVSVRPPPVPLRADPAARNAARATRSAARRLLGPGHPRCFEEARPRRRDHNRAAPLLSMRCSCTGDPALIAFDRTFPAAAEVSDLIRYTGYVTATAGGPPPAGSEGEVLVSAGGGAVGAPLLFAALEAKTMTALNDHRWRLLTGPNLAPGHIRSAASKGGFPHDRGALQGGFPRPPRGGSPVDLASRIQHDHGRAARRGTRHCNPYESGGETEQRLRSETLAEKGVLTIVPSDELSPERLAEAWPQPWRELPLRRRSTRRALKRRRGSSPSLQHVAAYERHLEVTSV